MTAGHYRRNEVLIMIDDAAAERLGAQEYHRSSYGDTHAIL